MAAPNLKERAAMATTSMLEARVNVLALAVECIASSLAGYQASEAAAVFRDGLSRHLTERDKSAPKWTRRWRFRRDCCFARLVVEVERAAAQMFLAPSAAEAHPDHAAVARIDRAVEAEVHERR
jgi:hypothetical protein